MKRLILTCCLTAICALTTVAQKIYEFQVADDLGKQVSLADYKGKVLLIVNTPGAQYHSLSLSLAGRCLGDNVGREEH